MKSIRILLMLEGIVMLLFVASCTPPEYTGEDLGVHLLVSIDEPLSVGSNAKSNLIETDGYGRKLFSYSTGKKAVLAICQYIDTNIVGFYEDYCCIMCDLPLVIVQKAVKPPEKSDLALCFGDDTINELKRKNDWNEPMVAEMITSRRISDTASKYAYLQETLDRASEVFQSTIALESGADYQCKQLDMDKSGNRLYYVYVYKKTNLDYRKLFFIILKPDGVCDTTIGIEEMCDMEEYHQQLHDFKSKNDWCFA